MSENEEDETALQQDMNMKRVLPETLGGDNVLRLEDAQGHYRKVLGDRGGV